MWHHIAYNKAMHFKQPEVANLIMQTDDPLEAVKIMRFYNKRAVVSSNGRRGR